MQAVAIDKDCLIRLQRIVIPVYPYLDGTLRVQCKLQLLAPVQIQLLAPRRGDPLPVHAVYLVGKCAVIIPVCLVQLSEIVHTDTSVRILIVSDMPLVSVWHQIWYYLF